MELYKNKELFKSIISEISNAKGIAPSIIEKDYFVSLVLKDLSSKLPNMIFKGGTSLSKCYGIIHRFSKDIDITLEEEKPTQGERSAIKKAMLETLNKFDFSLLNEDEIKSRMEYNKYKISYPASFQMGGLKDYIYVESVLSVKAFPVEIRNCTSIIYDFLKEKGFDDVIKEYDLAPFKIKTQTLERTFIDKIFALCDYYIDGRITEHSRHIYDIYKLYSVVDLNEVKALIPEVRKYRKNNKFCFSANDSVDIKEMLGKIINEETYKHDYANITEKLLYEKVSYDEAIQVLGKIAKSVNFK